ncbi:unnamed protein product, partial [Cyprideis torosa]
MGGLAQLAAADGHRVTGADQQVYPPMSDQLNCAGIEFEQGFESDQLERYGADVVVVGNVMSRGRPIIECMLEKGLDYTSGPQWLAENVLRDRWVLAVSGTHGKTSTASMLAWILDYAGMEPGFLIGGVPANFGVSARLGGTPFFVIEADEYDTAFFDKRSKFVHYRPRTLVINNIEFDHADIFRDLDAIQTQFHHLMRMIPGNGLVVTPLQSDAVENVMRRGLWTPVETVDPDEGGAGWSARLLADDGSRFEALLNGKPVGVVDWSQIGRHNISNALSAIAAARHAGVPAGVAIDALGEFRGIKRRLETRGEVNGVVVYDDFAHHPTAIQTTIAGLRAKVGKGQRVLAVMEPRSNTMKLGVTQDALALSFAGADLVYVFQPEGLGWDATQLAIPQPHKVVADLDGLVKDLVAESRAGDHILVMSNGGFGGIHLKLLD